MNAGRLELGGFLNLAVTDAGSADFHSLCAAVHSRANALQVHIPAALRNVMSMADAVAELWPAPTNFTILSHKTEISFDLRTLIVTVRLNSVQLG
jgi:hypothetical protein